MKIKKQDKQPALTLNRQHEFWKREVKHMLTVRQSDVGAHSEAWRSQEDDM